MEHDELLSLRRLAASLKLPLAWLRAEADAGRIPCLRAGRRRLFHLDSVHRVLVQRASGTEPTANAASDATPEEAA